jgi:restriction system protein
MTLPSYVHFTGPLLEYLGEQHDPVRTRVVYEALAERLKLSEPDLAERLPSGGQTVFQNRVGWAQDALKRAGFSSAPSRGAWLITDAGRKLLDEHGGHVPEEEMERIGNVSRDVSLRALRVGTASEPANEEPDDEDSLAPRSFAVVAKARPEVTVSPREQIENAIAQIRGAVTQDLLEYVSKQTPEEFEELVLEVLFRLGYGTTREDLQRVGRSGDGGIDGIVSLDRLGLQKVYVQAKRWQGQVGAPVVQGFVGALQLQNADKGVLITSGTISRPAREAAKQARGSVVLIDGARLAELMIDKGVGVSNVTLQIPKLDTDYFEGE